MALVDLVAAYPAIVGAPMTVSTEATSHDSASDLGGGPESLPPGQIPHLGRYIALIVFFGVIIATIFIVFMPERTVEREDMIRLEPKHVLTVRMVGERGLLEMVNEGPSVIVLRSPTDGAPLAEVIELQPQGRLSMEIRGVGVVDVLNPSEVATSVRWRGSGPEPLFIDAVPPRPE